MTPTVRKVACGADDIVPLIQATKLARSMRLLQERGIWLFETSEHTDKSLYHADI
jgi:23S rRNA (guanosine2251-2'-O)-methyltransferase